MLLTIAAPAARAADDPDQIISSLRQVAADLNTTVKRFQLHLDQEIMQHDRGYRTARGRRIPGADADLIGIAEPEEAQAAIRKFFVARMMDARQPGYQPAALADCDRLQTLIQNARGLVLAGNDVMRQFLIVPARDLNSRTDAGIRTRRTELLKVRDAATEAAKRALIVLPFELPVADSSDEQKEDAWNLVNASFPVKPDDKSRAAPSADPNAPEDSVILPLHFEQGKRITLIHDRFRRITLIDSGLDDAQGRRLFYQEDWEQRQGETMIRKWAVAVNTSTGQHTLLRRYPIRDFQDDLNHTWISQGTDYPPGPRLFEPGPPSIEGMTSAIRETSRSRQELSDTVLDFRKRIRETMTRNDRMLAAQKRLPLDDDLPVGMRETLFAIRGHLARAEFILEAEDRIRRSVEQSESRVRILEARAAWLSGDALEREGPEGDSRALLDALNMADTELGLARSSQREALAILPPDSSRSGAQFPALMKDTVLRIRSAGVSPEPGTIRCRQEIWRFDGVLIKGERQTKRTIVVLDLSAKTGTQIPVSREVRYYQAESGENLENIFDENAAQ
jgi:hypothetical protein